MYMYSAHDTTLSILLLGLGVFNNLAPPYATTVLVELHKMDEQYYVKMFLRNDTNMIEPPHELILPGCSTVCPLDRWNTLVNAIIPHDWKRECGVSEPFKLSTGALAGVDNAANTPVNGDTVYTHVLGKQTSRNLPGLINSSSW
ncbi:prostatic acid phosphatase-like isoform X2 [Homarus americanus]|uniref:prostatic acid phosphatase-like isoform X2 n=1 Tax=Homarus americanus TaxID=6706 RepID=UPI001C445D57|nr:prostatic acid phosphatase-like isoform X2 [Homarus americanus]